MFDITTFIAIIFWSVVHGLKENLFSYSSSVWKKKKGYILKKFIRYIIFIDRFYLINNYQEREKLSIYNV